VCACVRASARVCVYTLRVLFFLYYKSLLLAISKDY